MSHYLVADLFCGAGGSSTGAERAVKEFGGEMELVCVNHWPVAIETHKKNHPTARHYIEDVATADPERIVPEGWLDLLMASPECRFYSRARGGKPIHDQSRMNPWVVQRWLTALDVRCVLIENVSEFVGWGPLTAEGKPDRNKKGVYFEAWIKSFWELGYAVEWKCLNAADFGDATTRTRFFLQARKDGAAIRWPELTHTPDGEAELFGGRARWRGAREIIDWANPGRSLLDHPRYLAKPLSEKTRRRIARGLQRFGGSLAPLYINLLGLEAEPTKAGDAARPFIMGKQSYPAFREVDEPIPTLTTDGAVSLVQPILTQYNGKSTAVPVDKPLPTQTGKSRFGIVNPLLVEVNHGDDQKTGRREKSVDEPLGTLTTHRSTALVKPILVQTDQTGGNGGYARSVDTPAPTIVTSRSIGVVLPCAEPFIVPQFGEAPGQPPRTHEIDQPLPSITSHGAGALVRPLVIEPSLKPIHGGEVDPNRLVLVDGEPYMLDIRFRMLTNEELAKAMGFTSDEGRYEFVGNVGEVTKQIGNAVAVNTAVALVRAILAPASFEGS